MTDAEDVVEGELFGEPSGLTVKAFSAEYRAERDGGHPLNGRAFSHEEVREVLIDLLDKLSWIAQAKDVRAPAFGGGGEEGFRERQGFNAGLDRYKSIILETKAGLEALSNDQET